ncbi:MAG: maltose alpha-D-glucosyltransferase [Gemmataceae bacterium]
MLINDPLWYKDAIIYELHVRAFHDAAGNGTGDFRGLTQKLDYLQDLGVTAIWLLPFYPSPLKDDGYDIADYTDIHPDYGTLDDFKEFLDAAHQHGLRVITELVINHTSDQHPWFQRARRAKPGTSHRDFYVWSDTPDKYQEARIIFKDFEQSNWTWDPIAKAHYWHRFYHHQPDLNFDNPDVWNAIFPVLDFWLDMGVDGMRLDAIPYLYQREGTNCENLPETHEFLRALRKRLDQRYTNRMFLAEANQWPEDAVEYFGNGDECHMCFHFPVMPRLFMAIHMEDRFPVHDIMAQTPTIPDNCQWAMFLRNHDELTLEMVTDEERDYMYRAYAADPRARINLGIRRRLAPLLGNNRRRIELMNALLFSLPGTPIIYYGEEIGMGDNIYLGDRNGVRTPMQWSGDRNAGFSRANPQKLYLPVIIDPEYHYEALNVEAQQNNPTSLLWWMKRLMALRKRYKAFSRGTLEFLHPDNHKILAFLRRFAPPATLNPGGEKGGEECILIVANLSRFVQYVELDLSKFNGIRPIELFGRTPFPAIGKLPYLLTLGPHSFYWFALEVAADAAPEVVIGTGPAVATLSVRDSWEDLFRGKTLKNRLEDVLVRYLRQRRWFGGKARTMKNGAIRETFRVPYGTAAAYLTLIDVEFTEGAADTYVMPLSYTSGEAADILREQKPHFVVAQVRGAEEGVLFDALGDGAFCAAILEAVAANRRFESGGAEIQATAYSHFAHVWQEAGGQLAPTVGKAEQSNTSILFGAAMIMKLFRKAEEGINPDLEIGRYLTEQKGFAHTPPMLGAIEYRRKRRAEPVTLAQIQAFVPNQGDAWQFTLNELSNYFDRNLAAPLHDDYLETSDLSLVELAHDDIPAETQERIGVYLESVRLLGQRTAELHLALADESENPAFVPESFTTLYQRSVYQSMRNYKGRIFELLRKRLSTLPESIRTQAQYVLRRDADVLNRLQALLNVKITALRTRCHGDYHLGQVLYTGKDFVIIDFEGEPARSISERRLKRSPLRDVAGMVRSFHYAAYSALSGNGGSGARPPGVVRPEDVGVLEQLAHFWYIWVSATFLKAYLETAGQAPFIPSSPHVLRILLEAFLMEKAIYELGYELNHRPDWVRIPLLGILKLLPPEKEST